MAAAERPALAAAIVSRGGRVDLSNHDLERVRAPTLLLVGEYDEPVLNLNVEAARGLPSESKLVVIPGATHLFEERGALDEVATQAARWFTQHLVKAGAPAHA
jgi:pimeloyl-ACP methyl ester carboxylesterase